MADHTVEKDVLNQDGPIPQDNTAARSVSEKTLNTNDHLGSQLGEHGGSTSPSMMSIEKPAEIEEESSPEISKTRTAQSAQKENAALHKTPTIATLEDKMPHSFKLVAIMLALCLSIFLVSLDMTIVSTAIPEITNEFHSLPDVGWYGSAFFLTLASFQAFWGKVYRYIPLKGSFLVAIFIFEVGSLICAVAPNSVTLIVGRAIAGVGGAGIASGAYTLMAFAAPPEKRAMFTGTMGAAYGIASVIGPIIGGVFTQHATWRWCFYVNLPVGAFSAGVIFLTFTTPDNAKPQEATLKEKLLQFDFPGTFVLMAAVICFLLAIQWGGTTKPWSDSTVIGLIVGFALLAIVFIAIEYFSGDRALIQGRLLKSRSVLMACLYIFFFAGSFFLLIYQLPLYFQSVQGADPSDSGVRTIPLLVATSVISILSGAFITATGYYQPSLLVGAALNAIGIGLVYSLDIDSGSGKWIGYQILAGIGIGLGIQTAVIVGQASVDNSDLSTVTAMVLFFQTIGGAFFVQGGQSAFSNKLLQALPYTAPNVNPQTVLEIGASNLRQMFTGDDLHGILVAWLDGQRDAYILAIALACVAFLVSCFTNWKSIKGKLADAPGAA